jgi:hypothetical protein
VEARDRITWEWRTDLASLFHLKDRIDAMSTAHIARWWSLEGLRVRRNKLVSMRTVESRTDLWLEVGRHRD